VELKNVKLVNVTYHLKLRFDHIERSVKEGHSEHRIMYLKPVGVAYRVFNHYYLESRLPENQNFDLYHYKFQLVDIDWLMLIVLLS